MKRALEADSRVFVSPWFFGNDLQETSARVCVCEIARACVCVFSRLPPPLLATKGDIATKGDRSLLPASDYLCINVCFSFFLRSLNSSPEYQALSFSSFYFFSKFSGDSIVLVVPCPYSRELIS